jgi:hypothetical protein
MAAYYKNQKQRTDYLNAVIKNNVHRAILSVINGRSDLAAHYYILALQADQILFYCFTGCSACLEKQFKEEATAHGLDAENTWDICRSVANLYDKA